MSKIDVGDRVKRIRTGAAMSGRDFAARLQTSVGRISEIENGKSMPGGEFLMRLHAEFGVDLNWLMAGMTAGAPPLTADESALIDNYRHSAEAARAALRETSDALAKRDCDDDGAKCA